MKTIIVFLFALIICYSNNSENIVSSKQDEQIVAMKATMPGTNFGQTLKLEENGIPNALANQVGDYTWNFSSTVSVSDKYAFEPRNIVENNMSEPIYTAKTELGISGTVGCGPLSLYSTMEYLSESVWFDGLKIDDGSSSLRNIATKVLQSTRTYSIDSQRLTSPQDMKYSFCEIMSDSDYNNIIVPTIHSDLQSNISNAESLLTNSIDEGYPIIWWCYLDNDVQYNHYLVIYAYQLWTAIDGNGNLLTQPIFKARYNQEDTQGEYYVFPEMFTYPNGAMILNSHKSVYRFDDSDITSTDYYPYIATQYQIAKNGEEITGDYLRTGYISDVDNEHFLVLSPRRQNAGRSYITFHFEKNIRHLYVNLALWSSSEYLDFVSDSCYIEIGGMDGTWFKNDTIPLHQLTTSRTNADYYHFVFQMPTHDVRITINSDAIGTRNKGRLVLHNLCFIEALEENNEQRYICKFAETQSVQQDTTTYIAGCDKGFAESMGITLSSGSNPNYYTYVARPSGPKQITNVRRLYNDLNSLKYVLNSLQNDADNYGVLDKRNNILGYIRSMNDDYANYTKDFLGFSVNVWDSFAGTFNSNFSNFLDEKISVGVFYRDFFYAFLEPGKRNYEDHGTTPSTSFIQYFNHQIFMIDPLCSLYAIDLIHMFASIDGTYSLTGTSLLLSGIPVKEIASWGGDLQTAINSSESLSLVNEGATFETTFFDNDSACSREDMNADMDACNISRFYLNINFSPTLLQCVSDYYSSNENNYHGRFSDFIESASYDDFGFSGIDSEVFEYKTYFLLAANRDDSSLDLYSTSNLTYFLINSNENEPEPFCAASLTSRRSVASLFIDYVYENMGAY